MRSKSLVFGPLALLALFAVLAAAVKLQLVPTAGLSAVDLSVTQWFASVRTPAMTDFFLLMTQFGGTGAVLVVSVVAFGYFLWRMRTYALPFLLAVLGNSLTVFFLKEALQRARPSADFAYYFETLFSFPSGHSAIAVAAYGFIAYALVRTAQGRAAKSAVIIGAVIFILLIGISRLYLGVHYLSDVIGGFVFGGAWLLIGILAHRRHLG